VLIPVLSVICALPRLTALHCGCPHLTSVNER
jgi:hypothetical protein